VPVGCIDVGVRLGALPRRIELRDLRGDRGQQTEGERGCAERPDGGDDDEEPELADAPALRPA
jgi:hypothetical protein